MTKPHPACTPRPKSHRQPRPNLFYPALYSSGPIMHGPASAVIADQRGKGKGGGRASSCPLCMPTHHYRRSQVLSISLRAVSAGGFPANQSLAHAFGARRRGSPARADQPRARIPPLVEFCDTSSVTPFRRNTTSLGESAQERGRSTVKPRDTLHGQSVESHSIILGLFGCPCSAYSHTENLESLSCH